jgi:hypothetical protein
VVQRGRAAEPHADRGGLAGAPPGGRVERAGDEADGADVVGARRLADVTAVAVAAVLGRSAAGYYNGP